MFYTHVLLNKHGILAKIWIAAHWQKKLTKSNIFECNLEIAIQNILSAKMVMSLRISGHLLLGVVRVYNRKTKYLLADCNESLLKMKLAFRPEMLDLSHDNLEAQYKSVTRPEDLTDFDHQLSDLTNIDMAELTMHQSRVEDITLKEDYNQHLFHESIDHVRQDSGNESIFDMSSSFMPESTNPEANYNSEDLFNHDLFGDEETAANAFAHSTLFAEYNALDMDTSREATLPESPRDTEQDTVNELPEPAVSSNTDPEITMEHPEEGNSSLQTEISFVLEPLDSTEIEKRTRMRKKRKLMVDDLKQISSTSFRQQLEDTSDTLTTLDVAPPKPCMMEWQKTGGVQWLLSEPAEPVISTDLQMLFTQNQRSETANKNRPAPAEKVPEMPSEPEVETHQQDQEELVYPDLPQLEAPAMTDVSSTYSQEPSETHELLGLDKTVAHESSLAQEESTENMQDSNEHQWTKRTQTMLHNLKKMNQSGINFFNFNKICENDKKKEVATKFYSLLVLKNKNAIRLAQNSPYDNIIVTPGPQFHTY